MILRRSINKRTNGKGNNNALLPTQPRIIWAPISNPPKYFGGDNQVRTTESELLNNTSTTKSYRSTQMKLLFFDLENSHFLFRLPRRIHLGRINHVDTILKCCFNDLFDGVAHNRTTKGQPYNQGFRERSQGRKHMAPAGERDPRQEYQIKPDERKDVHPPRENNGTLSPLGPRRRKGMPLRL